MKMVGFFYFKAVLKAKNLLTEDGDPHTGSGIDEASASRCRAVPWHGHKKQRKHRKIFLNSKMSQKVIAIPGL